jgi:hypothetical protein
MTMNISRISALAFVALLAGGGVASAQQASAMNPQMAGHGWDPAAMHQRMEARRATRLKALHDVLAIRPDQEGAFQAFTAAMTPPDRGLDGRAGGEPANSMDDGAAQAMTTPERVDRMTQRMDERMARRRDAVQRGAAAAKALYAALDPNQRRVMDALPMLRGPRDGQGGHRWGGHGMGGHGMDGHDQG